MFEMSPDRFLPIVLAIKKKMDKSVCFSRLTWIKVEEEPTDLRLYSTATVCINMLISEEIWVYFETMQSKENGEGLKEQSRDFISNVRLQQQKIRANIIDEEREW